MIVKTFDQGWGREYPLKQYEQSVVTRLVRPYNIPQFLQILCEQTSAYWQKKFVDLQEKILYNKTHFADYITQQKSIVEKGIPCPI